MPSIKVRVVGSAAVFGLLALGASVLAVTNVDPVNKYSWGENIGHMNWRDANGGTDGVEVFNDHLEGYIWCENVGWINTSSGGAVPYANTNNTNYGVNINPGTGECSGFAWGENIGWVNFGTEPTNPGQGAHFNFGLGRFEGYAWGENIGWINLDDANEFVEAFPAPACCLGDGDGSGNVDFADIQAAIVNWLGAGPVGDADCNGTVDFLDIQTIIIWWLNPCPNP